MTDRWRDHSSGVLAIMYRSNRSFNMPPPPGHTPGIWQLCRPGEEGIWLSESSRGWGIWSPCFRGGKFELHPRFHVKSFAWRAMWDAVLVACENIRFSSLFVAGDVSRGGTSATQRQKFHTDDVKSVRNPVRSADWSTQQLHCFSYCLWMTDKRQKATKVKCKREESLTKPSIFVEYSLL